MKFRNILLLVILSLVMIGCNESSNSKLCKEDMAINILDVKFDSSHKYLYADVQMNDSIIEMLLNGDKRIHFKTEELLKGGVYVPRTQPTLESYENLKIKELSKLDMNVLILADLTMDSIEVDKQYRTIKGLRKLFKHNPFRIAFINGKNVSETMDATDYVLDNYFKAVPGKEKYLYRSILSKMTELQNILTDGQDSLLSDQSRGRDVLMVFSDGKVYGQNVPLDSEHFLLQHKLVQCVDSTAGPTVFYVNLKQQQDESSKESSNSELDDAGDDARIFLTALCQKTGGDYLEAMEHHLLLNDIVSSFNSGQVDYRFTFVNPDFKIYRGVERNLQISCYISDSLIASDFIAYNAGSVYNPIIVNGLTTFQVIVQGGLLGLLAVALLYLFFQFILPAISYLIFKRKYIIRYTNKNMGYNGVLVEQSCYFCKAPFEEGDEIVVKCQHALHKSCWDENEYKCPEYGQHCKHGSHYYNRKNLFDHHNALFYFSWILAGAFAGIIAWIFFTANANHVEDLFLVKLIYWMFDLDSSQAGAEIEKHGGHLLFLPFYGMNIGFFLTLSLSLLTGHGRWLWRRTLLLIIKSVIGGFLGYLSFFVGCIISLSLNFISNSFFIDCIPWMISGFVIAFVVAYGTDIKMKKALIGAAISIVFGLGSMYVWTFTFNVHIDTREFLLLSYMIYCIGFAVSIAVTSPKSERYFLRVEGPIKEMDIAVYKWMNASSRSKRVLIGKSVNCDLQMSWDITSHIAPEQAEVRMINGYLYLTALEDGVIYDKKNMKPHLKKKLYHGSKFVIGKTTFTYIEKDL